MGVQRLLAFRRLLLIVPALLPFAPAAAAQQPRPSPAPPARVAAPAVRPTPAAKPTPAPPPSIEGVVRGPDRKPIEKAIVIAVVEAGPMARFFGGQAPVSTRTGPDGRFRLTLRKAQAHTVRVEAAGLAAQSRKGVSPGASLAFDLARGGTIEGVVRDGETGQPAPRARVEARGTDAIPLAEDPGAGRVVTLADTGGRFKLEGLAAGLHTVTARSRMAGFASRSSVRLGARLELLVFPAATISGTVTGADGKPVPRAVVSVAARPFGRSATTESADEAGRYELNGLDAGLYDVIARAPGMAPGIAPEVALDRRSDARVDLVLRPGARVLGRIIDTKDRPLAGRVSVGELDGRPTPFGLVESLRAEAQADGRFAIEGLPAGEHALGVTAPGQAPERVEFAVRAGDRQVDVGEVRLDVGLAIRGRVRAKQGAPIADATVRGSAMRRSATWAEATTEADGSFVLAGLEQALYNVSVQAPGFGPMDKQAEPGGDPLELVLEPAGAITGQVVDDRGNPVDSFRVTARNNEGPGMRRMPRTEEVTAEDGRFSLDGVSAGTYVVHATAPERAAGSVSGVTVAAGSPVDVGTIKLGAGGTVRGTVVESGGGPIAGARISASGQGRDWISFGPEPDVVSDGSGAFEIKGVAAGAARVTASHPGFARSQAVTAEVDPAKGPADVRIVMSQGGRIEGSVRRRDGTPMPSLMVSLMTPGIGMAPTRDAPVTTGSDGRFVIEHAAPGTGYLTVLSAGSGAMMQSGLRREVEVREGETTNVDLVLREIVVSGRVTRAGAPAPGLRVEAMGQGQFMMSGGPLQSVPSAPSSGPQRMTGQTRDDGAFEMIVDEPGRMQFNVTSADGRLRLPMKTVEIPDADAFSVDLAFAGVPVSGVVVDKETEAPLGYANVFARRKAGEGPPGGSAVTSPDGRFQLELDPGDYTLGATMRDGDYGQADQDVRVGDSGVSDVRLALAKGLDISGKITDAAGRAVSSIEVTALPSDERPGGWGWSQSLPDGSFKLTGLSQGTYTLAAPSGTGAFAVRPGVATGAKNVGLVLQPGGRIMVTAVMADGQPVSNAWSGVDRVNGLPVNALGHAMRVTDAQGTTEMLAPAGDLRLYVRKDKLRGTATVSLAAGETVNVTVRVEEPALVQ